MSPFVKFLLILLLIVYIFNPFDILPDTIPLLGWLDDGFLAMLLWYYLKHGRFPFFSGKKPHSGQDQYHNSHQRSDADDAGTKKGPSSPPKTPHEILGLKPGASREEIHDAYRRMAQAYHPDKVNHLGPELQELARQKFVEIQNAYETLLKNAG